VDDDLAGMERVALAHAGPDGHVCGKEESLISFALATLRQVDGARHVFVTPEETRVQFDDHVMVFRNGDKMRAAIDGYLYRASGVRKTPRGRA
jgi:hypothetical protein